MSNFLDSSSSSKRPANSEQGEEDGTSAKKQKMNTAFVQIVTEPAIGPFSVVLSQKCLTVEEHTNILLDKINQSQGAILDGKLKLDGPVALLTILKDNSALMDYNVQLDEASMYTFHFKLATGEEGNVPNLVEQLAIQMAQLEKVVGEQAEKMEGVQGHVEQLQKEKEEQKKLVDEKIVELEEKLAQDQRVVEQLAKEKDELAKQMKEQAGKMKELEKNKFGKEKEQASEYAKLIGAPNMANLEGNYEREKLLQLIQHGNGITKSIYVQNNQKMDDRGLVRSIVDLLASIDTPEKMVVEVTIEAYGQAFFEWPENAGLKLKEKKTNMAMKWNEASANQRTCESRYLAEYELANKQSRVQVLLYYQSENHFNKLVEKFIYRRLA